MFNSLSGINRLQSFPQAVSSSLWISGHTNVCYRKVDGIHDGNIFEGCKSLQMLLLYNTVYHIPCIPYICTYIGVCWETCVRSPKQVGKWVFDGIWYTFLGICIILIYI